MLGVSSRSNGRRKITGSVSLIRFGDQIAETLRSRPISGPLFSYMRKVRAGDRAAEFKHHCEGLGIKAVLLHSYRYTWAERAKTVDYPNVSLKRPSDMTAKRFIPPIRNRSKSRAVRRGLLKETLSIF